MGIAAHARSRTVWLAPVLFAGAISAAVGVPDAGASACARWGDQGPASLSTDKASKSIVCLINRERESAGRRPLVRSRRLQRAALRHSRRMRQTGCFAHRCPAEASLRRRVRAVGYLDGASRWGFAENIAWAGQRHGAPRSIVSAWMNSPPHRGSMLEGRFRDVGVGFEPGSPGDAGAAAGIYTVVFGLRVR